MLNNEGKQVQEAIEVQIRRLAAVKGDAWANIVELLLQMKILNGAASYLSGSQKLGKEEVMNLANKVVVIYTTKALPNADTKELGNDVDRAFDNILGDFYMSRHGKDDDEPKQTH